MSGNTMDPNIQSSGGYTPLHVAAINKSHKVGDIMPGISLTIQGIFLIIPGISFTKEKIIPWFGKDRTKDFHDCDKNIFNSARNILNHVGDILDHAITIPGIFLTMPGISQTIPVLSLKIPGIYLTMAELSMTMLWIFLIMPGYILNHARNIFDYAIGILGDARDILDNCLYSRLSLF